MQAGNALMTLIVCLSAEPEQQQETVSTLRFGSRALGITNFVMVNKTETLEAVVRERDALRDKVALLDTQLQQPSCEFSAPGGGSGDRVSAGREKLEVRSGEAQKGWCYGWGDAALDAMLLSLLAIQTWGLPSGLLAVVST